MSELSAIVVASAPSCGTVRVVAIDGGAGAGKSTLAAALAASLPASRVLGTDDLLDGWADQFGYWRRLQQQVLEPLSLGRPASYRRYDWHTGRFDAPALLAVPNVLVVEGVSAIAACGQFACVRLFVDVPRAEREQRWATRDGGLPPQATEWLEREDLFFRDWSPPGDVVFLRSGLGTRPGRFEQL